MTAINLDPHFEAFVEAQIARGRYRDVDEVVRAGLALLEVRERDFNERARAIKAKLDEAWDDPRPSMPVDEVFDRLELRHAQAVSRL